jgi:hypothetical protein
MAHRVADRDEREARADDVLGPVHHLKSEALQAKRLAPGDSERTTSLLRT